MTLVDKDRQWFKAKVGLQIYENRRDWSFCNHAIKYLIDYFNYALQDETFINNPLVTRDPDISFYASFPLRNSAAHKLGTLFDIDRKPGHLISQDLILWKYYLGK